MSKVIDEKKAEKPAQVGFQFGNASTPRGEKSPYQAHVDNELKHPASVRPVPGESMQPYGLD